MGDGLIVKPRGNKKLRNYNVKIRKEKLTNGGEMIIKLSDDCSPGLIR